MKKYQEFQSAARENGYTEANVSGDGSTVWFRKEASDRATKVHKRLCVDVLTSSATVFWQTVPGKLSSKTFRTVSSLKAWFVLTSEGQLGQ
jgi:homoserine kinase